MLGQAIKMGFKWETLFKTQEKKKKVKGFFTWLTEKERSWGLDLNNYPLHVRIVANVTSQDFHYI